MTAARLGKPGTWGSVNVVGERSIVLGKHATCLHQLGQGQARPSNELGLHAELDGKAGGGLQPGSDGVSKVC